MGPRQSRRESPPTRIDFADAAGVFQVDYYALTREDRQAQREHRLVTVGMDFLGRILTVVYTYREERIPADFRAPSNQARASRL